MKKLLSFILISLLALTFIPAQDVQAATFNKNRLIDDSLFTDTDSMSVAQIQAFLESKGSLLANWRDNVNMRRPSDNCIVHHATNMTAAEVIYQASQNWGAQVYNSNGCAIQGAYWDDAGYSNYKLQTVSPKVLLVMLQKEQSLLTADGTYSTDPDSYKNPPCCDSNRYKLARAMGYGVPDSGGINEKYLGFYNQINWAAWQLRFNYERAAGNTSWDGVGYITHSGPMIEGTFRRCASCNLQAFDGYYPIDGSPLYMDNRATASLYYYTPHTYPGFYGNYNFVQFYSDYFGSVYTDSFKYSYHSQTANPTMMQGYSNTVKIRFKNTGSEYWYDEIGIADAPEGTQPTYISTDQPTGFASSYSRNWATPSIPSKQFSQVLRTDGVTPATNQHMVKPGQVGEYTINLTAPMNKEPGTRKLYFTLVRKGNSTSRLKGQKVWTTVTVLDAKYNAQVVSQTNVGTLGQTELKPVQFKIKNTGNVNWYSPSSAPAGLSGIRLATFMPLNSASPFSRDWDANNRPLLSNFSAVYRKDGTTLADSQNFVKPGQYALFNFNLGANYLAKNGNFKQYFKLVKEGASSPLFGPTMWLPFNYNLGTHKATWVSQSATATIAPGASADVYVKYKNNGTATWYDTAGKTTGLFPVRLATNNKLNRISNFDAANWDAPNRPQTDFYRVYATDGVSLAVNQHRVLPGQTAEFRVRFTVPLGTPAGNYNEFFTVVKDGAKHWKMEEATPMWFNITVQ